MEKIIKRLGPGFITSKADNDAGAVATYISAGAFYGYNLFWLILLLLPITYFYQELAARLAVVTKQGPITLIRNKFGEKWATVSVVNLFVINFLTLITEFAAINLITQTLGLNPYIFIPLSIIGLFIIASPHNYKRWERTMIFLCLFDLCWFLFPTILKTNPASIKPIIDSNYLYMVMGIVGTTVAPWQGYLQHSALIDKDVEIKHLKNERWDTFIGSCFTILVAILMMYLGSYAFYNKIPFTDVPNFVSAISSTLGNTGLNILFLLIINASVIGTAAVSMASTWAYAEYKRWPRSLNYNFKEARQFYMLYYLLVGAAGLVTLIPSLPMQTVIIGVQVMACIFLPYQLIILQMLSNDKTLMGSHANTKLNNLVINSMIVMIIILSMFLLKQAVGS